MNHERIVRTVLGISAGYVVLLAFWSAWLVEKTPPDTVPYQIAGLVGLFGTLVGLGMMLAARPTRADRRLRRRGVEGWARIRDVHPLSMTDHHTELTQLDLELTIPGSETYTGSVVFDVAPIDKPRMAVGEVISIRVDPAHRDRIILCP